MNSLIAITFYIEKHMKNNFKQMVQTMVAVGAVVLGSGQVMAAGSTDTWKFANGSTQSAPVENTGGALASVTPGSFSSGWTNHEDLFGATSGGVWDLGSSGKITVDNVAGVVGDAGQDRVFTVKVTEWNDGGIYNESSAVSVPGADLVSSTVDTTATEAVNATTSFGQWVVNETKWHAHANAHVSSAVITGAQYGSVVNQVALVSNSATVVAPPQLSINQVAGQTVISWPSSYSDYVLESTSDLNNPQGWTAVSVGVQVNGGVASVTVDGTASQQFYRLSK